MVSPPPSEKQVKKKKDRRRTGIGMGMDMGIEDTKPAPLFKQEGRGQKG